MRDRSQTFMVGGAVRDRLRGLEPADRDWVVVGATPREMTLRGFKQVGASFPVFLHPETGDEHALARTERKSGSGHTGFAVEFGPEVTLEDDLSRRDLTVNAMAVSEFGRVVDPFGGRDDLEAGVLRHVGPAFADDPLRVFRVARFAATLGFSVADETMELMQSMTDELRALPGERVAREMVKALESSQPSRFFEVLAEAGALGIFFEELKALRDVPAGPREFHGSASAFEHTMRAVDAAAGSPVETVFAALVHDLGKGLTPREGWPKHHGHEKAGVPLVRALAERLRLTKRMTKLGVLAAEQHMRLKKASKMRSGKLLRLLETVGALHSTETLEALLEVVEADSAAHRGQTSDGDARRVLLEAVAAVKSVDTSTAKHHDHLRELRVLALREVDMK